MINSLGRSGEETLIKVLSFDRFFIDSFHPFLFHKQSLRSDVLLQVWIELRAIDYNDLDLRLSIENF